MSGEDVKPFVRLAAAANREQAKAWQEALSELGIQTQLAMPDPLLSVVGIHPFEVRVPEPDLAAAREVLRSLGVAEATLGAG